MLSIGDSGPEVKALQEFLLSQGYELPKFGADGDFGPETQRAVMAFQKDQGLSVDGIVGPNTQGAIDSFTGTGGEAGEEEGGGEAQEGTGTDAGGGVTVTEGAPSQEQQAQVGVGTGGEDPETQLTILTSQEMEWFFDEGAGKWYVSYGMPNSDRKVIFEAEPDQMDALFGAQFRPEQFQRRSLSQLTGDTNITFGGNIAEVEGKGAWEAEIARVTAIALDNGVLPEWAAQDGAALDIIFIAQAEGKSNDWVLDQLARTPSFQQRFPDIEQFRDANNLTMAEAVTGFLEMESGVRSALQSIGEDPSSVSPEVVGGLLTQGHSLTTVQSAVRTFKRIQDHAPALQAFNQVLAENGMQPLETVEDMFNFVNGEAEADLYDLWEASSIQEAANVAGLGDVFGADNAIDLALQTPGVTSLDKATEGFQKAAELILRLRHEVDVGEFGLSQEDLIDISLGRQPTSGASSAEVFENINRAVLQAQARIRGRKAGPFIGFTPEGTPRAQSLGNLR